MNKFTLLIALLGSLCLFSCKKEHNAAPGTTTTTSGSGKLYPVSFNVSADFTQSITTIHSLAAKGTGRVLATSQDSLKQNIQVLSYYLFDVNGKLLHKITQNAGDANFGSILDTVATGTYTAVLFGSADAPSLYYDGYNGGGTSTYASLLSNQGPNVVTYFQNFGIGVTDWTHAYAKQYNLVVGTTNQQQKLVLEPLGAQLEVDILDSIPASVNQINLKYSYNEIYKFSPSSSVVNLNTPGYNSNYVIGTTGSRSPGYKFSYPNLMANPGHPDTTTISLIAYKKVPLGSGINATYETIIPKVTLMTGKKTVLSGYLFQTNNKGNGFTVSTQPLGGTSATFTF